MSLTKRIFRIFLKSTLTLFVAIALYFISAYVFMYIPVNTEFKECDQEPIEIYLLSNGVHTDFVVPIKNEVKDWSVFVDQGATQEENIGAKYVSFGWGDKGFYLETPTWGDLKFSTAFKALFWMSSSAMHVSFYRRLNETERCIKVAISRENYLKLVAYIESSFEIQNGESVLIPGVSYEDNDVFYEARGRYNMFFTCNTWTNSGLKAAGLKACLWTPFEKGILHQYSK